MINNEINKKVFQSSADRPLFSLSGRGRKGSLSSQVQLNMFEHVCEGTRAGLMGPFMTKVGVRGSLYGEGTRARVKGPCMVRGLELGPVSHSTVRGQRLGSVPV